MRIAYLNSHYPAVSHTFIEREVTALRRLGMEIHTFSVRPCAEADLKSESMRREFRQTQVLLNGSVVMWAVAHALLLLRRPGTWFSTLGRALRSGDRTPRARLWQVFYFGEAVVLHDRMRRLGLRHVHVHHANVSADVARLACFIGNRLEGPRSWRWSLTIHGSAEFEMVHQWDVAAKVRQAEAVACISDFCRAQILRLVEPSCWTKVRKVHMSVDPAVYQPPSHPRGHDGPLRVVTVGRLVPLKGFPLLVEALERLDREGLRTSTRVIGQGEMHQPLQESIRSAGLDVTLVGAVGQDDIIEHYHWADVFVLPSFLEGLPVVLMEAMATELPVIATRIGAVSELVADRVSGKIIPPARADLLADAIRALAEDPARRAEMGRVGRQAVLAEFTTDVNGPAMLDFFRDLGESANPRQGS